MALTPCSVQTDYIQGLSDRPNETDGLTADALKQKFDQAGTNLKSYINSTLISELDTALGSINTSLGEMNTAISTDSGKIGTLSNLTTTTKTDLVSAINEVKGNIIPQTDFMLASNNAAQTLSSANTTTLCNINTVVSSNGSKLTFDSENHAIKIGAGVNYIEVSGGVYFSTAGSSGTKNVYVYKNLDQAARAIKHISNNYETLNTQPKIIAVQENDLITLKANSQNGTTTEIAADPYGVTGGLMVRVIG